MYYFSLSKLAGCMPGVSERIDKLRDAFDCNDDIERSCAELETILSSLTDTNKFTTIDQVDQAQEKLQV